MLRVCARLDLLSVDDGNTCGLTPGENSAAARIILLGAEFDVRFEMLPRAGRGGAYRVSLEEVPTHRVVTELTRGFACSTTFFANARRARALMMQDVEAAMLKALDVLKK